MSLLVGVALFVVVVVFGDDYLKSYHPLKSVLQQAQGYLYWMRFTILLLPLDMLMAEMVYYDGDESISTLANAIQGIGNVGASLLLSHYMGIKGIALASFLFTFFPAHGPVKEFAFIEIVLITGAFDNTVEFSVCFMHRIIIPIGAEVFDIRIFPLNCHPVEVLQRDPFKSSADKLSESILDVPGIILLFPDPGNGAGCSEDKQEVEAHQIVCDFIKLLLFIVPAIDRLSLLYCLHSKMDTI